MCVCVTSQNSPDAQPSYEDAVQGGKQASLLYKEGGRPLSKEGSKASSCLRKDPGAVREGRRCVEKGEPKRTCEEHTGLCEECSMVEAQACVGGAAALVRAFKAGAPPWPQLRR